MSSQYLLWKSCPYAISREYHGVIREGGIYGVPGPGFRRGGQRPFLVFKKGGGKYFLGLLKEGHMYFSLVFEKGDKDVF